MSTLDETVVLLAPEEETAPEHALHEDLVDLLHAGIRELFAGRLRAAGLDAD